MDVSVVILTCWMSGAAPSPMSFNLDFEAKRGVLGAPYTTPAEFRLDKAQWSFAEQKISGPIGDLGVTTPDKREWRINLDLKTNKLMMVGESPNVTRLVHAGTCEVWVD